jgi:hypothetical protein
LHQTGQVKQAAPEPLISRTSYALLLSRIKVRDEPGALFQGIEPWFMPTRNDLKAAVWHQRRSGFRFLYRLELSVILSPEDKHRLYNTLQLGV